MNPKLNTGLAKVFKRLHYPFDVMLLCVRWYVAYPLSLRHLDNIVEQDRRAIKRRTRPMMGFKNFRCARIVLGGIEVMHMIRKGQMKSTRKNQTAAEQFYSLAF